MDRPTSLDPLDPTLNNWKYGPGLELSDAQFVSPPTSIRAKEGQGSWADFDPPAADPHIARGRFEWCQYLMQPGYTNIIFRAQDPTTIVFAARYYLHIGSYYASSLWIYEPPGPAVQLGTYPHTPLFDQWERFRLSWIAGCTNTAQKALAVLLEQHIAGSWVVLGSVTDTDNRWLFSPTNRFGFWLASDDLGLWTYLDDSRLELVTTRPLFL